MEQVKRLVLDVLKPHKPNSLEFARGLVTLCPGYKVRLVVDEMDDKTESVILEISGDNIDYETIAAKIRDMGGSIHSIDEVIVVNPPDGEVE